MSQNVIRNIIKQLRGIQEGGLWLDESFKSKIEKITSEDAFSRPIPEVHSVAELLSHVLVWRKEVLRRLNGQKTDLMNSPDNWRQNDELIKIGWDQLKNDFDKSLAELISLLENLQDIDLENKWLDTNNDLQYLVEGLLHHDLYHLGQLGITIKLLNLNKYAVANIGAIG